MPRTASRLAPKVALIYFIAAGGWLLCWTALSLVANLEMPLIFGVVLALLPGGWWLSLRPRWASRLMLWSALLLFCGGQVRGKNSDFLIETWQNHEGVPESAALAVAQTPDGYLWVGSQEGLLRFNGVSFTRAEKFTPMLRLHKVVPFLQTDRSGRLWAGGEGRLALYDRGNWHGIFGTNIAARSVAEDLSGQVLVGGTEGQLYTVIGGHAEKATPPAGVQPSGVFCLTDAKDGRLWLANRGFIGRLTAKGWKRIGPAESASKPIIAAPAKTGGIWVYSSGELRRYQADGKMTKYPAPILDQARELMEDRSGEIWVASVACGLTHFLPGETSATINVANGFTHNAIRCVIEDLEGNIWAGGSVNGLNRLKPRQFHTLDRSDGLPDNIVRSLAETAPGQITVGTHGGGLARIQDGKVVAASVGSGDSRGQYVWSLAQDRRGRLWIGTFNEGLFVQENGVQRQFPLTQTLGKSIARLMEDAQGRIWVGGSAGLGIIEGSAMTRCFTNSLLAGLAITSLVEDPKSGMIWVGTFANGVFQLDGKSFDQLTKLTGLPGERITSLTIDAEGYLWIGMFEHGLASLHAGQLTLIGAQQGLAAVTIGSILDDGHGWFWLGTTHGILRVARDDLHRVARQQLSSASFNRFDVSDGLGSEYCAEGYQPNALRDHAGRLWFGTDRGVVTVDPAHFRLNTNPPPVVIERVSFTDRSGSNHVDLSPHAHKLVIPAGSVNLGFYFDGLSFTAPEKMSFKYQLEGAGKNWVTLDSHGELHFRAPAHGNYVLHLAAANNDGVWNETGTTLAFVIQPFLWQTLWFRLLVLFTVAGGGGFAAWRMTCRKLQRRIEQLQQQQQLEQERARLATVMENTSDLVVFADSQGGVIHLNPAGRRLIGLAADAPLHELNLAGLQPRWAADLVAKEGLPAARKHGTWEGETALLHRDGHEIPVSQVIIAHKDATGLVNFISTIARDITDRKRAEARIKMLADEMRLMMETIPLGVVFLKDRTIKTTNLAFDQILGRDHGELEELVTANYYAAAAEHDRVGEEGYAALARGEVYRTETAMRRCDGSIFPCILTGQAIAPNNPAAGSIWLVEDITERKRAEADQEQLEAINQQLQKSESLGRMAGAIAHNFNNHLQPVIMGLEMAIEDHPINGCPDLNLTEALLSARKAAQISNQMLVYLGQTPGQFETLDLSEICRRTLPILTAIMPKAMVLKSVLPAPGPIIFANANQIQQVLTNLLTNAWEASHDGAGDLHLTVRQVSATDLPTTKRFPVDWKPQATTYACLEVADSGCGILAGDVDKLFDPFYSTKFAGRGLGLSVTLGIVKKCGGTLTVTSAPGQGSVFRIFLPATLAEVAPKPAEAAVTTPKINANGTVLVVDDDASVRKSVVIALQRSGFKVIAAANGFDALTLFGQHREEIGCVLCDLTMPNLDGWATLAGLRQLAPGIPAIIASGYNASKVMAGHHDELPQAYLHKPYEMKALIKTLRQVMSGESGDQPADGRTP